MLAVGWERKNRNVSADPASILDADCDASRPKSELLTRWLENASKMENEAHDNVLSLHQQLQSWSDH